MPIDEDHSNLVKFGADDPDCRVIIDYLYEIANDTRRMKAHLENATSSKTHRKLSRAIGDDPKVNGLYTKNLGKIRVH